MYQMYIDGCLFPVAPSKISIVTQGKNKVISLTEGHEINRITYPKLKTISLDVFLPEISLPFAQYESCFLNAHYYLNILASLANEEETASFKRGFDFQLVRERKGHLSLGSNDISIKVSLESYEVVEEASDGSGITVHMVLKEYRTAETLTVTIKNNTATIQANRATTQTGGGTYTVQKGDTLWMISKWKLNNASRWKEIYTLNANVIEQAAKAHHKANSQNGYWLYAGTKLTLPRV